MDALAGIGLKDEHALPLLEGAAAVDFLEIHAENYFVAGGPRLRRLERLRERLPLSLHGVGLSIGGEAPLDEAHLDALAALLQRFEPRWFSEHLAWSSHGGTWLNDLLPLPYDDATLQRVCEHIDRVQTRLRRPMLLENPSSYVAFESSTWDEGAFIAEVVRRTGCGVLLDVNNVYVSACNLDVDPGSELDGYLCVLPPGIVGEIHLAGHARVMRDAVELLIDDHGSPVVAPVWQLYERALASLGRVPTLIEWDTALPGFGVLVAEAGRAQMRLDALEERHACVA